ncbi:MAG: BglII/BstYI family type II restriction endonuclease [Planctomycetaceae bacterium]
MKAKVYGHRFGDKLIPEGLINEAIAAIDSCSVVTRKRSSKKIKEAILESLAEKGWPGEVTLDTASKISITSRKQSIGLCFQTGNMSRMYADLLKLQAVYLRGSIEAAILILPENECAKLLGDNIANCDRLRRELEIFDRAITVPLAVIGIK